MNKNEPLKLIMTSSLEKTEIFFENEIDKIPVNIFSDYLRYFKALYSYLEKRPELLEAYVGQTVEELFKHKVEIEALINDHFNALEVPSNFLSPNYQRHLDENDIYIEEIRKESPLSIIIGSTGILIVAAVIISGGEMDFLRMRFKVNALGEGLAKLKELFHRPNRKNR